MEVLQEYNSCPWCHYKDFASVPNGTAFSQESNHYLAALAEKGGMTQTELISSMNEKLCLECGTYFLDPWISKEAGRWLFSYEKAVHRAGWMNFYKHFSVSELKEFSHLTALKLFKFLESCDLNIEEYYEVGCPFLGLLVDLVDIPYNNDSFSKRYSIWGQEFEAKNPWSARRINRITKELAFHLNSLIMVFRTKKNTKAREYKETRNLPSKLGIIYPSEIFFWGTSCFGEVTSCRNTLQGLLGIQEIDIAELSLDLAPTRMIAFHNYLDHSSNPKSLLEAMLEKSNTLLIQTHQHKSVGRQHRFSLRDNLILFCQERNLEMKSITNELIVNQTKPIDEFLLIIKSVSNKKHQDNGV